MTMKSEIVNAIRHKTGRLSTEKRISGCHISSEKYPFAIYLSVSEPFRKDMISKMGIRQKANYYLNSDFVIEGDFEVGKANLSVSYWKGKPEMLVPGMPEIVKNELEKAGFDVEETYCYHSDFYKIVGTKSPEPEYVARDAEFLKDLTDNIRRVYKEDCEKTRINFEKQV